MRELKAVMLRQPERIVDLLEFYDFSHIEIKSREIRFARNEDGGPNISIRLEENENLTVVDYVKNVKTDIFAYIMSERSSQFVDVANKVKELFHIDGVSSYQKRKSWFREHEFDETREMSFGENRDARSYDEDKLSEYIECPNIRFFKDHITFDTQQKFHLLYNVATQRIGIPVRDEQGRLCGIKARRNYDTDNDDDPKYIYELPCDKSLLLYGYQENYNKLYEADVIYIGEAEKFVMQCDSYGYRNAVSIMGSSLSPKQASLLIGLRAKRYCFMFDRGLEISTILSNVEMLKRQAHNRDIVIEVFDAQHCDLIKDKDSATDHGKAVWEEIIKQYIIDPSSLVETETEDDDDDI